MGRRLGREADTTVQETAPAKAGEATSGYDLDEIRNRAKQNIARGAVIPAYSANRERVLKLLNTALATEIVCVLRYKRHYEMARGIHAEIVADEFLEHAKQEQEHADNIARRITQLNGEPNYDPDGLTSRSQTQYVECTSLMEMIQENLIAERIVIESYGQMIREIGNDDPTTRRLFEHILQDEENHADELSRMLVAYQPSRAA